MNFTDDFIINKTGDKRSHSIAHDDDVQQTYFSKTMELFFTPRLEIFVYLWRECWSWPAVWETLGGLGKWSRVLGCGGAGGQHCPVSTLSRENMVTSGSRPAPPQGAGTALLEVIMGPMSLGHTFRDVN